MATANEKPGPGAERSLREEQVEATRQAIVRSARRMFGSKGYASTSVDEIARDARVTKGAVYHHFDTKEGLFRAVYDEAEADAQARTVPTDIERPPLELLVGIVQGYLDAVLDPEIQQITLIDGPAVLGPFPDGVGDEQPGYQGLRTFLEAAIDRGAIQPLDADALAHLIGGACLQAGFYIAHNSDDAHARPRVGAALEAMVRGLAPSPSRSRRRRSST